MHKQTRRVTQRGRKKYPQLKGMKESPKRVVNLIEVSKLSDTDFKIMIIRKLKDLSENYEELCRSYKHLLGTTPS